MAQCSGTNCLSIYYFQAGAVAGTVRPNMPFYVGAELWQNGIEIDGEILDWYITPSLTDHTILAEGTAVSAPKANRDAYPPNVDGLPFPGFPVLHVRYPGNGTLPATITYVGAINVKGTDGCIAGATQLCPDGVTVMANCVNGGWVPTGVDCEGGVVCNEGEQRSPLTCPGGSIINQEVCQGNQWVASGQECPEICNEGDLRSAYQCPDESTIYLEVCQGNQWVESGQQCGVGPPPINTQIPLIIVGAVLVFGLLGAVVLRMGKKVK